uniref:Uncharacterized protein n=1 Tax=Anguilla anguilla TaxID=7936 RepID=A0A0E9TXZ1_ANGAN
MFSLNTNGSWLFKGACLASCPSASCTEFIILCVLIH